MKIIDISDKERGNVHSMSNNPVLKAIGSNRLLSQTKLFLQKFRIGKFYILMFSLLLIALSFRFLVFPKVFAGTVSDPAAGPTIVKEVHTDFTCLKNENGSVDIKELKVKESNGVFSEDVISATISDLSNFNSIAGVYNFKINRVPVLVRQELNKEFLGKQIPYAGNVLYLVDRDEIANGVNVSEIESIEQVNSKFVLDLESSANGDEIYLLEAEPISTVKLKSRSCFNCAEIEFNLLFTKYRYDGEELTFVEELVLTTQTVLVDNIQSVKVEDTTQIRIDQGNLYSRGSTGGVLNLQGNELIGWEMKVAPSGQKLILLKDDSAYYPDNQGTLSEIEDFDKELGYSFFADGLMWRKDPKSSKVALFDISGGGETLIDGSENIVKVITLGEKLFTISNSSEEGKYELRAAGQYITATDSPALATIADTELKNFAYSSDLEKIILVTSSCQGVIVANP